MKLSLKRGMATGFASKPELLVSHLFTTTFIRFSEISQKQVGDLIFPKALCQQE